MEYEGPTADDLDNVQAMNRCFLSVYAGNGAPGCGPLGRRRLRESELARLSAAPFLLFSCHECDTALWERLLGDDPQLELTSTDTPSDPRIRELTVAALGFLWQLSRRNPFAARVVSGAPVRWCQVLASVNLMTLTERVAGLGELLVPRFHGQDDVWRRLLGGGVSSVRQLRLMSHQSALQSMLTQAPPPRAERLSAAACRMSGPQHRVAASQRNGVADKQV